MYTINSYSIEQIIKKNPIIILRIFTLWIAENAQLTFSARDQLLTSDSDVYGHQTSFDVKIWRLKSIPARKKKNIMTVDP